MNHDFPATPVTQPGVSAGRQEAPRFFALDCVRATAMMLGVLFHAIMFGGGMMMMGFGQPATFSARLMDWIHSFRMPLFFLISGFFSHMMLSKHGLVRYLQRRWWRIAIPLLLVLFALAGIRAWTGIDAFPGGGGGRPGPPGEMPPPPPGFVPPFLAKFDKNSDGTLDAGEWKEARADLEIAFRQGFPPPGQEEPGPAMLPDGPGFAPGGPDFPGRPGEGFGGPPPGFGPGGPMGFSNRIAETIFGSFSRGLSLQHLWFLWYLLVFTTAAPAVTRGVSLALDKASRGAATKAGTWMLRWGVAPLCVAILSVAGLLLSGASPGRPPSGVASIMGVFPDVCLRYDGDWPYFFLYFLAGWGLYALRDSLADFGRLWLPILLAGFGAYVASNALNPGGPGGFMRGSQQITLPLLGRHLLFAAAVSFTVFGLIGFFQRYLNRPTSAGRYLADTAFWVYLVHQDLLNLVVLRWVRPWGLPQLLQALVAVAVTTAIALLAFELFIRHTPLTALFGPARARKLPASKAAASLAPVTQT